jgi:hypothetical protein
MQTLPLTAVSTLACSNRSTKAILALDRQHGIYRDRYRPGAFTPHSRRPLVSFSQNSSARGEPAFQDHVLRAKNVGRTGNLAASPP